MQTCVAAVNVDTGMGGSVGAGEGEGCVAVGEAVAAMGLADGTLVGNKGAVVVVVVAAAVGRAVVGEKVAPPVAVVGDKDKVGLVVSDVDGAAVNPAPPSPPTGASLLVALLVPAIVGALVAVGITVPELVLDADGAPDAPLLLAAVVGTKVPVVPLGALAVGAKDAAPVVVEADGAGDSGAVVVKGGSVSGGVVTAGAALAAVTASSVMLQKLS